MAHKMQLKSKRITNENIGERPHFLKGKGKKDMAFHAKDPLSSDILERSIKARVSFRGDERGGR